MLLLSNKFFFLHVTQAESGACYRAIMLASEANCPRYVTRVMSQGTGDVVADMKRKGKGYNLLNMSQKIKSHSKKVSLFV